MVGFIILETLLMAVGSVCRWCFRPGNLEDYGWVFDDEDALIDGHDGIHMSSLIHTARSGSNMHLDSNGKTRRRKVHINNHPQPHTMPQAHESSSSVCCVICLDELTSASTDVVKSATAASLCSISRVSNNGCDPARSVRAAGNLLRSLKTQMRLVFSKGGNGAFQHNAVVEPKEHAGGTGRSVLSLHAAVRPYWEDAVDDATSAKKHTLSRRASSESISA
eukprot:CAMPEP_0198122466 /NCGR_PEP_ID=MMETSP1442-20131203/34902_1 /TAXON_ID= /ORGANISM="Craspedostauros australis, Strain CCMP3328" /LENGTH=220 /DNA_ID=CAMNT_0043781487 /DNA_START=561 /DNA_END=1225 /DNA_ORIENTATION=-